MSGCRHQIGLLEILWKKKQKKRNSTDDITVDEKDDKFEQFRLSKPIGTGSVLSRILLLDRFGVRILTRFPAQRRIN